MSSTAISLAMRTALRVADLARYSQDRDDTAKNIKRQHAENCALIERYPLWKHDPRPWTEGGDYYFDDDIGAADGDPRPGYEAFMAQVRAGHYDAVVIPFVSRLWRNDVERSVAVRDFRRAKCLIFTTRGQAIDLNDSQDEAMLSVSGVFASLESKTKSTAVREDVREAFEAGAYHGSVRPFGYRIVSFGKDRSKDRTLERDPAEAPLVLEAALRVTGPQAAPAPGRPAIRRHQGRAGESLRTIAADFSARGVRGVRGGPVTANMLRRVLTNPVTGGWRERQEGDPLGTWIPDRPGQKKPHGRERDPDTVERRQGNWHERAILGPELYEQVCEILGDPARSTRPETPERRHLLTGFAFGGDCGHRLHVVPVWGKLRIRCVQAGEPSGGRCVSRELAPVEATVRARVFEWMRAGDLWDQSRLSVASGEARTLLAREQELVSDLDQWLEDYGDKTITKAKYLELKARDEQALRKVRRDLERYEKRGEIDPAPGIDRRRGDDFIAWWKTLEREGDAAGLAKRRDVLAALISRIDVYPQGKGHRVFDPDRVQPRPAAWSDGLADPSAAEPAPRPVPVTTARQQITEFLAAHPGESFLAGEIAAAVKYFPGTVKTQLSKLTREGVVTVAGQQGRAGMRSGQRGRGAYRYAIAAGHAT